MDKTLSYCTKCNSFFMAEPGKVCLNCGNELLFSEVTEAEWNGSSEDQKNQLKHNFRTMILEHTNEHISSDFTLPSFVEPQIIEIGSKKEEVVTEGRKEYSNSPTIAEKKLVSYRSWSIVILVIGVLSNLATLGEVVQGISQGYIYDKMMVLLYTMPGILGIVSAFFGKSVLIMPSRLRLSYRLYILDVIAVLIISIVFRGVPISLFMLACVINIYNGIKLEKLIDSEQRVTYQDLRLLCIAFLTVFVLTIIYIYPIMDKVSLIYQNL